MSIDYFGLEAIPVSAQGFWLCTEESFLTGLWVPCRVSRIELQSATDALPAVQSL